MVGTEQTSQSIVKFYDCQIRPGSQYCLFHFLSELFA